MSPITSPRPLIRRLALLLALAVAPFAGAQDPAWEPPPPRALDPAPPPVARTTSPPAESPPVDKQTLVLLGALVALLLGFCYYQFVWEPKRRSRPLREALVLLEQDDPARFKEAERLLADALTAGMRKSDVAAARFSLAYVRARLGRFIEASAVLADLDPAYCDRETVYLDLWLQSKQKAHERVEAIYREHANLLGDLRDTKLIAGIAYLERARTFWAAKQVGSAVEYFKKLRDLNVLTDEIPEHIDDHEVVLGIAALFEQNYEQAQKHFTGAVQAAAVARKPATAGELGVLLCTWKTSATPEIDDKLGTAVERIAETVPLTSPRGNTPCPHCHLEFRVALRLAGRRVSCRSCRRGFKVPAGLKEPDATLDNGPLPDLLLGDDELLLRNVLLWHAVSLLFGWRSAEEQSGLTQEDREELTRRLNRVLAVDPDMPDPHLIGSMIGYLFAVDDTARQEAVEGLENAVAKGVSVPEVLNLIERENKLAQFWEDSLARFYAHLQDYLADGRVPEKHRQALRQRLCRFQRFREIDPEQLIHEEEVAPSLTDLQNRSHLLRERVRRLERKLRAADQEGDGLRTIEDLMGDLDQNTQALLENAQRVQDVEQDLMATTSEFLLEEEEAGAGAEPEA